jgi:DNA-binding MarR family transcriptional regulator
MSGAPQDVAALAARVRELEEEAARREIRMGELDAENARLRGAVEPLRTATPSALTPEARRALEKLSCIPRAWGGVQAPDSVNWAGMRQLEELGLAESEAGKGDERTFRLTDAGWRLIKGEEEEPVEAKPGAPSSSTIERFEDLPENLRHELTFLVDCGRYSYHRGRADWADVQGLCLLGLAEDTGAVDAGGWVLFRATEAGCRLLQAKKAEAAREATLPNGDRLAMLRAWRDEAARQAEASRRQLDECRAIVEAAEDRVTATGRTLAAVAKLIDVLEEKGGES